MLHHMLAWSHSQSKAATFAEVGGVPLAVSCQFWLTRVGRYSHSCPVRLMLPDILLAGAKNALPIPLLMQLNRRPGQGHTCSGVSAAVPEGSGMGLAAGGAPSDMTMSLSASSPVHRAVMLPASRQCPGLGTQCCAQASP